MPRFFESTISLSSETFIVRGENARHISSSLRMLPGEKIIICDGNGNDYDCIIKSSCKDNVILEIVNKSATVSEPKTKINLFQCLPKRDKLENIIQKSTELGVSEIFPVESLHCISKASQEAWKKKIVRYQKIALEAAKQSGRGRVPHIHDPAKYRESILFAASIGEIILFYERGDITLKSILSETNGNISVFIGPEGGFSDDEVNFAVSNGAHISTLGKRILRTETAPIAAISAILYEKGDFE